MKLDFKKTDGLIPAIVQDFDTKEVLMVAFLNEEAWQMTVDSGVATFWSRSRKKLWIKGETSGHKLMVRELKTDCDQDAVVMLVEAIGPGVCHEGYRSCFSRELHYGNWVIAVDRAFDPAEVYA